MLPNLEGDASPLFCFYYNNVTNKGYLTHTQEKIMSNNTKSGFEIKNNILGEIYKEKKIVYILITRYKNKKVIKAHSVTTSDVISVAKELYEFVNQK